MQLFAYITHKNGLADDSAQELATAASKISPDTSITAIVTGSGDNLNAVCEAVTGSFSEVIKVDSSKEHLFRANLNHNKRLA